MEWEMTRKHGRAISKINVLLSHMIQDHHIDNEYRIMGKDRTLLSLHNEIDVVIHKGTYNRYERDFLNEVRNLVLHYKHSTGPFEPTPIDVTTTPNIHSAGTTNQFTINSKGQPTGYFFNPRTKVKKFGQQ